MCRKTHARRWLLQSPDAVFPPTLELYSRPRSFQESAALTLAHTGARVSEAMAVCPQTRGPLGCLDPDPEALRRVLAGGPRPFRAAPRSRVHPRAPLGANEGRCQAPLALVVGDRPPEDRQNHGRGWLRETPDLPEGSPAQSRHRTAHATSSLELPKVGSLSYLD